MMSKLGLFMLALCISNAYGSFQDDQLSCASDFEKFLTVLDAETHDVEYYEDGVKDVLSAIKFLYSVYSYDYALMFKEDIPNQDATFRKINKLLNQIDVTLSRIIYEQPPSDDENVLKHYKDQRAPIASVEENVRLYSTADSNNDRQHYLRALREECQKNNPGRFFFDRTHSNTRDRSMDRKEALSVLSSSQDRNKLTSWVKLIAGDAVRAMSLHQACLAATQPPVSSYSAEKYAETAWKKVKEIMDDLGKEAKQLQRAWEKQFEQVSLVLREQLAQFDEQSRSADIVKILEAALSAKYPTKFFGVYALTGPFVKRVFNADRVIEIPFGTRTIVIISNDVDKQNLERQNSINAYAEKAPCAGLNNQEKYQEESMTLVKDQLRKLGATVIYITDGGYTSRSWPQSSVGVRGKCDALYGPNKLPWKYTRSLIIGY